MREFIVTLRCGKRYTVKADRVAVHNAQYLALLVDRAAIANNPAPEGDIVSLFERSQVTAVMTREHLVSEEKCDSTPGPYVVGGGDDPIPF
ncbi:MAG: hypothetical protein K8U57_25525 [Planctomycetes bacterium]|nr:hypothetical protein [Planctomycetota bacterium]